MSFNPPVLRKASTLLMPDLYQLAPDVTQDLESIAQGKARLKTFLETRPELQVSRCEHH
jgi:hypothetical protein